MTKWQIKVHNMEEKYKAGDWENDFTQIEKRLGNYFEMM